MKNFKEIYIKLIEIYAEQEEINVDIEIVEEVS